MPLKKKQKIALDLMVLDLVVPVVFMEQLVVILYLIYLLFFLTKHFQTFI